jgi:elongation of very long chain fatty acids protein 6
MGGIMDTIDYIENGFEDQSAISWSCTNWHYSLYISAFYVVSIFCIKYYMKNKDSYNLRSYLFLWSLALSLFSAIGFYRFGVPHMKLLFTQGFESSVCTPVRAHDQAALWIFVFLFGKAPELIDTYFIVLRKQKLIFLHWYHHITVFIFCWYHMCDAIVPFQWFVTMNYFVHTLMYFYYAVRASGRYTPPRWINMVITIFQILQMVIGVAINVYIGLKVNTGWVCDGKVERTYFNVSLAISMYFTYFILFAYFFYQAYCVKKKVTIKND